MTTTNKGLIQPANGSYVDTWDQPVNNDWSYIDAAFGGVTSLNATGVSAVTLTLTQYQPMAIAISGAMSNNVTYTIPSGVGGNWIVRNTTTDATGGPWTVTFASGGGGSTVTVIRSVNSNIWSDGTNMYFSDSRPAAAAGSNTQIQYNSSGLLGGANVYYNDTSGNVGIGTTSPGATLDVNGTSVLRGTVNITSGNNLDLYNSDNTNQFTINNIGATGSTNAGLSFVSSGVSERMRIDTSGNVGIGTTSPSSFASKLVVGTSDNANGVIASAATGLVRIGGYSSGKSAGYIEALNTAQSALSPLWFGGSILQFATSGSEAMRIDSSGNVGIGTTSPGQNLTVVGSIEATNIIIADNQIQFGSNSNIWYQAGGNQATLRSGASGNYTYFNFISNAQIPLIGGSTLTFSGNSGSNEHMRIATNGSVGIGDSNPFSTLSISNTGNTGYNMPISATFRALSGALNAAANSSNNLGTFSCTTTNASSLSVHVVRTANGSDWTTTSMGLTYDVDTTQAAGGGIWFNNGRIGINTLTPDQALTVNGYIHSTSGGFEFPDNTVQTTAAVTATGTGGLYTYALLQYLGGAIAAGTNVTSNGSNLVYVDAAGVGSQYIPAGQIWQAMGYGNSPTLFQRTS